MNNNDINFIKQKIEYDKIKVEEYEEEKKNINKNKNLRYALCIIGSLLLTVFFYLTGVQTLSIQILLNNLSMFIFVYGTLCGTTLFLNILLTIYGMIRKKEIDFDIEELEEKIKLKQEYLENSNKKVNSKEELLKIKEYLNLINIYCEKKDKIEQLYLKNNLDHYLEQEGYQKKSVEGLKLILKRYHTN